MVKIDAESRACLGVLLLAACVLGTTAWLRGPEYDEQYTLFLTAGVPRPDWPETMFPAGLVHGLQSGHTDFGTIARDLRATDVHPPLYFWLASVWRQIAGESLFTLRLLSVLLSLGALGTVGVIARLVSIRPALAMLLTLGCYGFAYTGVIARGFMLAQLLVLAGLAVLLSQRTAWRGLVAGLLFGAATMANYLAVFVPLGSWVLVVMRGMRWHAPGASVPPGSLTNRLAPAILIPLGMIPFLITDFWFFVAQRHARTGQFPPFEWLPSLGRLGRYAAANLLGGLPLYVGPAWQRPVSAVLVLVACAGVGLVAWQWRRIPGPDMRWLLLAAGMAPPLGLLALGLVFDNTPIELRYLAFSVPFVALLLAGALGALPSPVRPTLTVPLVAIQILALTGMATRTETMQPARDTARSAQQLARDTVVLLPLGNDGVGIVGAFAREMPPDTPLLLIDASTVRDRIGGLRRVALAVMEQDDSSRLSVAEARAVLAGACWRMVAKGFNVTVHERQCAPD